MNPTNVFYAVFGNPVLHSRSPQLFNSVLGEQGFYTRIRPQHARDIVSIIRNFPLVGANITAPYKEQVLPLLDEISLDAKEIGAINTVVNRGGALYGFNTDHLGVTQSLRGAGVDLTNQSCLVLGGGGAARAAVYGLMACGVKVTIANRTRAKAEAIASDFGCKVQDWQHFDQTEHFAVVVSTLLPEALPPFFEHLRFSYLLDASYKSSAVSHNARKMGVQVINGKWWLVHQAAAAYRLFMGAEPPATSMANAFETPLVKDKLRVEPLPHGGKMGASLLGTDLLVSSEGMGQTELKGIIDEEVYRAFGG